LVRGQTNLLPPSRAPEALRRVCGDFPDLVCVTDGEEAIEGVETVAFPRAAQLEGSFAVPSFAADHVAAVAFTSGTTGQPTAHGKSWGALAQGAVGEAEHLGIPAGATLIGTVPPQHMYGLESTLLLAWQNQFAFHGGRPFYPDDIRAALATVSAPRVLVTTPLHLRTLLAESALAASLPPLDRIVSATAPLSAETAAQAEAALQAPVFEIYGCTEAGMVASRRTIEGPVWRTLPGVRIRCDDGRYSASGGHVPQEAPLADELDLHDAEHFELLGRLADVVNIAGKRASLAHLTHELQSVSGVRDAVFVLPPEAGDTHTRLTAYVVAPGLTAAELLRALRERIDPLFLPRPLYFVDALPRNATGKLPREALARLAAQLEARGASASPRA
jgi:acyl-coenzyme A synthetase/AMP-(fatty) acid ligase